MEHTPGNRPSKNIKPIVILIKGRSCSGKSTVSYFLNKSENVKYFSLDLFTIDPNLPINCIRDTVERLGDTAIFKIHTLQEDIFNNKKKFIEFCYEKTKIEDYDIFIFDGVYFNNGEFLNSFNEKFKEKYKVWVMGPI